MNKKDYKGYELVKAIHNREIKDGTRIEVHSLKVVDNIITVIEYSNKRLEWGTGEFDTSYLFDNNYYFRVLEDNTEEIEELDKFDIQGLEVSGYSMTQAEYLLEDGIEENRQKINELVKAVNELRKDNINE